MLQVLGVYMALFPQILLPAAQRMNGCLVVSQHPVEHPDVSRRGWRIQ